MAGPADASCAVAAALAEDSKMSTNMAAEKLAVPDSDDEGKAEADHSRRPLAKDTSRAQRQRPRAMSVKKKTKVAPPRSEPSPKAKVAAEAASAASAPVADASSSLASPGKKKKKGKEKVDAAQPMQMETD